MNPSATKLLYRSRAPRATTRYASAMKKSKWEKKACGCVKTKLPRAGKVAIRCPKHRGKPTKEGRTLCYFDDVGMVRAES